MVSRRLHFYCILYTILTVAFCIYWAFNYPEYMIYKGDEFFFLVQVLLIITYTFYLLIQFSVHRINFIFALLIPILTCIASFCTGFVILIFTPMGGIPRENILVYGLLYIIISVLAVYTYWGPAVRKNP